MKLTKAAYDFRVDLDGDYLNVLRRLAQRYRAKAEECLAKVGNPKYPKAAAGAAAYTRSAGAVENLIGTTAVSEAFPNDELVGA
jgi:hypothetical protein